MPAPIGFAEQLARVAYGEQPRIAGIGKPSEATPAGEFAERLSELVTDTDAASKQSAMKVKDLAEGRSNDLHGTMIAAEQAGIQLRLMTTVRNKVIEAYREVMRMGA